MGGLLALILAAEIPINGVFTMGAAMRLLGRGQNFARIIWPFYRYKKWEMSEYTDETMGKYNIVYEVTPVRKITDLLKLRKMTVNNMHRIHCPMLIIQGLKDSTVNHIAAQEIYERATGTPIKKILLLENSPHVVTTGSEFKLVWAGIDTFIKENL